MILTPVGQYRYNIKKGKGKEKEMKKRRLLLPVLTLIILSTFALTASAAGKDRISLKAFNVADGVRLSWSFEKDTVYAVFRKNAKGEFEKIKRVKGGEYTDKTVKENTSYTYYIKKTSKITSKEKTVVFLAAPEMKAGVNKEDGIKLVWDKVSGAVSYTVRRKTAGGEWKFIAEGIRARSFTDTKVKTGEKYYYSVRADGKNSKSGYEKATAVYRLVSPDIKELVNTVNGISVVWSQAKAATGYEVYRKTKGSDFIRIAVIKSGSTLSYLDKNVISSVNYTYAVKAVRGADKSVGGGRMSQVFISAPRSVTLSQDCMRVDLSWQRVDGAKWYYVYKRIVGGRWERARNVKADSTSCTVVLGSISQKVEFVIRAVGESSVGDLSEIVSIYRIIDSKKPMVALTYDDGPHDVNTHRILDVLERYNARATFFVVGSRVEYYSSCVVRADKLGCEIGNHSYSHVIYTTVSREKMLDEINKTNALIKRFTGKDVRVARAPGGSVGQSAALTGLPFIQWSIDTRDWESRSADKVTGIIKNQVRDGSIILMHDLYGSTAQATENVVPWLIQKGYQLVTVSEMMAVRGITFESGRVYFNAYPS